MLMAYDIKRMRWALTQTGVELYTARRKNQDGDSYESCETCIEE